MNVCIVVIGASRGSKIVAVAEGLSRGISANGHRVDIIDTAVDMGKKISFYDYIVIGTTGIGLLGGKIPAAVNTFLSQCGTVAGKKSFAFVTKGGIRRSRTLKVLMGRMEHEGMFLKYSELLTKPDEAEAIGKRLHIS